MSFNLFQIFKYLYSVSQIVYLRISFKCQKLKKDKYLQNHHSGKGVDGTDKFLGEILEREAG